MENLIEQIISELRESVHISRGTAMMFMIFCFIGGCSASSCGRSSESDQRSVFSQETEKRLNDLESQQTTIVEDLKPLRASKENVPSPTPTPSVSPLIEP